MTTPLGSLLDGPLPASDMFPDTKWEARTCKASGALCLNRRRLPQAKLAVAPGTVYGNSWEQRRTNAEFLEVRPVAYSPPLGPPLAGNPRVFLGLRAGGVSLGRVVLELRADAAPVAAENFRQLCAFGVYRGSLVHRVFDAFCIHGGDYNRRCSVVCPPGDATCFDLSLVPYAPGGRSVYSDRPDGLFDDEASGFTHAAGTLSMSNPGTANSNGSQWFITTTPAGAPPTHLDGRYVVFGQVLEGYDIVAAVSTLGRKDGTPRQRVVVEECGEVGAEGERGDEAGAGARAAAADGRGVAAAAAAVMARGGRAAARGARGGLRRGKWARVAGATLHARCLFA